jgi:hypothetical protein
MILPDNIFLHNTNVTSFADCFKSCTTLTTIPVGLFDYIPNKKILERKNKLDEIFGDELK